MNKTIGIVVAVVVVAGGVWYALSRPSLAPDAVTESPAVPAAAPSGNGSPVPEQQPGNANAAAGIDTSVSAGGSVGMTKDITVTGRSFSFSPSAITVKKGTVVRLTLKNAGGFHDFVIDELGVRTKQLADGTEETVTFTADKVGNFEYYCSVGNHRAMGMWGTLTVTE
ncbi:MAG: cupredoxin domain-containing protein [bacterium]|nr:cupredoxin domain-containing protein [bacterium]